MVDENFMDRQGNCGVRKVGYPVASILAIVLASAPVAAQQDGDVIVFRRQITGRNLQTGAPTPLPSPTPVPSPTPGTPAPETPTPDPTPGPGTPTPVPTPTPTVPGGGPEEVYTYVAEPWGAWDSTCSHRANRSRTITCRNSDGDAVDASLCKGMPPPATEALGVFDGCQHEWVTGEYSDWLSQCSSNSTRVRTVQCRRVDLDETTEDAWCLREKAKPATAEYSPIYAGCTWGWETSYWSNWSSTCSESATRTRTVSCKRSDGSSADETQCTEARPAASETGPISSGCGYVYKVAGASPTSACTGGTMTANLSYNCYDSATDKTVATSLCQAAGSPRPPASEVFSCQAQNPVIPSMPQGSNISGMSAWKQYDGNMTKADAIQIAIQYCGANWDYSANRGACTLSKYYSATENKTWLNYGQETSPAPAAPSLAGYVRTDSAYGEPGPATWTIDISRLTSGGYQSVPGATLANCGRTVSTRMPKGWNMNITYNCTK